MARHKQFCFKALLITEQGVGLWTYVWAPNADEAIEDAERIHGLEVVWVKPVDHAWFAGETLAERVAV
jgi:hypothetical protein